MRYAAMCLLLVGTALQAMLPGCARTALSGSRVECALPLPDEELSIINDVLDSSADQQLLTVQYGPEWRRLWLIDRRIVNGSLVADLYHVAGDVFPSDPQPQRLYETADERSLQDFRTIRNQIGQSPAIDLSGRDVLISSNPGWAAHICMQEGNVLYVPYPLAGNGAIRMAVETLLLAAAVDPDLVSWRRVALAEDVNPMQEVYWDANFLIVDPSLGHYAHIALDYFDLHQRALWRIRETSFKP